MRVFALIYRFIMICLIAAFCVWLSQKVRLLTAIAIAMAALALLCGLTGLAMRLQPPGRVTIINRLAGFILPWGFAIGRGKLLPIIIESWFRWTLMVSAILLLLARHHAIAPLYTPSSAALIILFISWVILGAVVLRLITNLLLRANSNPIPPGIFGPLLLMIVALAASVMLMAFSTSPAFTRLAMLLTIGPVAVIGWGYGLMVLGMITFGRNMRWN